MFKFEEVPKSGPCDGTNMESSLPVRSDGGRQHGIFFIFVFVGCVCSLAVGLRSVEQ